MKKITYQGQTIHVQAVNEQSSSLPILPDKWHQGDETLFRDLQGQYYLQRCLGLLDLDTPQQRRASGQVLTHRISLHAAALWAATRLNSQTLDLREDLAHTLSGFTLPDASHLDSHARRLLREYSQSRDVDPRDALNGAVHMALSADGLDDREATMAAKHRRLHAEERGCTVRFTDTEGDDPWEVHLTAEQTEHIQRQADAARTTFGEAFSAIIARYVSKGCPEEPLGNVTVSISVSPATYAAATRFAAANGRNLEESLAEWMDCLAEEEARPALLPPEALAAADRCDVALCAAAMPSDEGDEDDEQESEGNLQVR